VRAWGQIDVDYRAIVDRNGMVNIPRVGSIPVAGVPYRDITSHVRTALTRNFRNFELLVTLGSCARYRSSLSATLAGPAPTP